MPKRAFPWECFDTARENKMKFNINLRAVQTSKGEFNQQQAQKTFYAQ